MGRRGVFNQYLIADISGVLVFAVANAQSDDFTRIALFNAKPYTVTVSTEGKPRGLTPFWGVQHEIKLVGRKPKLLVKVRCSAEDSTYELSIPLVTEMGEESAVYRLDPNAQEVIAHQQKVMYEQG